MKGTNEDRKRGTFVDMLTQTFRVSRHTPNGVEVRGSLTVDTVGVSIKPRGCSKVRHKLTWCQLYELLTCCETDKGHVTVPRSTEVVRHTHYCRNGCEDPGSSHSNARPGDGNKRGASRAANDERLRKLIVAEIERITQPGS